MLTGLDQNTKSCLSDIGFMHENVLNFLSVRAVSNTQLFLLMMSSLLRYEEKPSWTSQDYRIPSLDTRWCLLVCRQTMMFTICH